MLAGYSTTSLDGLRINIGAAASLREGLDETLTVMRLGLTENLDGYGHPPT